MWIVVPQRTMGVYQGIINKKGFLTVVIWTITILDQSVMIKKDPSEKTVDSSLWWINLWRGPIRPGHRKSKPLRLTQGKFLENFRWSNMIHGCLIGILIIKNLHITGHIWSPKYPKQPVFRHEYWRVLSRSMPFQTCGQKETPTSMTSCPELPSVRTWLNQMNTGMQWPEHSRPWPARRDGKG